MTELYQPVAELVARVRARWRRLVLLRAVTRAAVATAAVVGLLLALVRVAGRTPLVVSALAVVGALALVAAALWALRAWRQLPSDGQIARFIEETTPALEERLVSAVSIASAGEDARPALANAMIRDAARAAETLEPSAIVSSESLRRAGFQAIAAVLALAAVLVVGRHLVRQSFDALALTVFPSRITIEVFPGDKRWPAGTELGIFARLRGNDALVDARLEWSVDGQEWHVQPMLWSKGPIEGLDAAHQYNFQTTLSGLSASFRYRVVAANASSRLHTITVVHRPRVKSIDVEYTYPTTLGLPPRREEDGGDIYAPEGTAVRLFVHTEPPAASGQLMLAGGDPIVLAPGAQAQTLNGALTVSQDGSYRVALADGDGNGGGADTEYFIRMLDDRPPEVHVVKPASDRRVTALEEVDIEAEADDDFGVASMELVYSVGGGGEKVVPLRIPPKQTSVRGTHTMYLEDLDVRAGDFVSYYVRARDLERGKRSSESRSDIFFLEIKPFEEEFTLAQSQAAMGGGASNPEIDDLVNAQKEIIVATWKLDRRTEAARAPKPVSDVHAVRDAEGELKTRVERAASSFGQTRMRTPRRPAGRGAPATAPGAGQTLPEEDAMTLAAKAMGQVVTLLDGLKTKDAVVPEMEALNQLLRAQGDVKKREVQRQQAGAGTGSNRNTQDLSSLFDKELARHQETNYELPSKGSQAADEKPDSALDKIKDLARRQDELMQRQQEMARRDRAMSEDERRRELAKLTREQNELQRQADELAQQMAQQGQKGQDGQKGQQGQEGQEGQAGQDGQKGQSGQAGQNAQSGQKGQPGSSGQPQPGSQGQQPGSRGDARQQTAQGGSGGQSQANGGQQSSVPGSSQGPNSRTLREISEQMRNAAGDLQRDDVEKASERASQALDKLRDLERQVQAASPDGRRRALGDAELEARQLADAERRIAAESTRANGANGGTGASAPNGAAGPTGPTGASGRNAGANADARRRLAGEQERLSDRLRQLQQGLKSIDPETAREIDRQRLSERMQESATALRGGTQGESGRGGNGSQGAADDIARALDRMADRMASAGRNSGDAESKSLQGNLSRVQELRDRIDRITRQLDQMNRQGAAGQNGPPQPSSSPSPASSGSPQAGQGQGPNGTGSVPEVAELQAQATRAMQELRSLTEQARRDDASAGQGGAGRTFEGQGMTLSAPGTEGFKQDFARWQELTKQVTAALDQVESSFVKKLQEKDARERLAAGIDDKAPAEYQAQVDSYFRALASRKKP